MTRSFRICAFALAILPHVLLSEPASETAAASAAAATNATPDAAESPAPAAKETPAARTPPADFERYRTIIDRRPFGKEPPNFNPDAPAGSAAAAAAGMEGEAAVDISEEEQRIISSVRVSVLNVTPRGKAAVGFTDSSKSPAVNYYLLEGESRDGWTFVSANVPEKTVVLSQNGVEATIPLGGSTPDAGKDGGRKGGRGGLHGRAPGGGLGRRLPPPQAEEPGAGGGAFAQLRAKRARKEADQRAEAEKAAAAAAQAKADREQEAAERAQQREALIQLQEELRQQREEQRRRAAEQEAGGDAAGGGQVQE